MPSARASARPMTPSSWPSSGPCSTRAGPGEAGARKRHMPFARAFDTFPRSLRVRLEEAPESKQLAIARYPELGVEILLLGSAEFGGEQEKDPAREGLLELVERLRKAAM